ncbi:MAG: ATP-binding protein [Lachnospiraceae bacterium]|nr:ATP-binding protein [Lachnospiraceae bacterium]
MSAHGFTLVSELTWASCYVDVNGEYLRRIFENITSNAIKYAEPAAEIIITTIETARSCGFSVMNTCAVSGCQTESSGIGIDSIRTMMRQMNGSCTVEQTETAFEITLLFPKL